MGPLSPKALAEVPEELEAAPEVQAQVPLVGQRADQREPEWAALAPRVVAQAGSRIRREEDRAEQSQAAIGTVTVTITIIISDTYE
ncbi:hypothetical protein ACVMAJ_006889 [Bradyrhizobium sp. USDA 4448]